MPTTPFLLLAAVCYARSSVRFHRWLLTNRWCGEYIRNYREGKGMQLGQKILTLLALWLTIGGTIGLAALAWWVDLLLVGIAIGVTVHLARLKTCLPAPSMAPAPPPLEETFCCRACGNVESLAFGKVSTLQSSWQAHRT